MYDLTIKEESIEGTQFKEKVVAAAELQINRFHISIDNFQGLKSENMREQRKEALVIISDDGVIFFSGTVSELLYLINKNNSNA